MYRTLSEVLKEADQATRPSQAIKAWNEILVNSYYYSMIEIEFAAEHLDKILLYRFKEKTRIHIPEEVKKAQAR